MPKTSVVAVLLADGFEEIEAVAIIDILRRAGVSVTVAAVPGAQRMVTGSHRITVATDAGLDDLQATDLAMVILPGGMPGSANLATCPAVLALVRAVHAGGGVIGAICAAPIALQAAGLLQGRRVTCYPSVEKQLQGAACSGAAVERDGRIVTGRGPGTAMAFALELCRALGLEAQATQLHHDLLLGA